MSLISKSAKLATAGLLLALAVDASAQVIVERPYYGHRHHHYGHGYGYGRHHFYRHHYRHHYRY